VTEKDSYLRMIAIDLLDEIFAESQDAQRGIAESSHMKAQCDALHIIGEGHDPKTVARALIIAISDWLYQQAGGTL
jgi:hypothetical protein